MPIASVYWEDVIRNRERLDVLASASRLETPWLIVHGAKDETVPVADAHTLYATTGDNAELHIVDNGTHTFGAAHPWAGSTPELRNTVEATLGWLDRHLR